MGIFATRTRRPAMVRTEDGWVLPERVRLGLPPRFEAVGEALASGSGSEAVCAEIGRTLAQDGAPLSEVLEALRSTTGAVSGREPTFAEVAALSNAWSESTLGYLHRLSCEDALTGLASLAHVRTRLSELYRGELRGAGAVQGTYALVVADLAHDRHRFSVLHRGQADLTRSMRLARLRETAGTVFNGTETIGQLGESRIVVIAGRDERLGRRVGLLRRMLGQVDLFGHPTRVWIEGLPSTDDGAAMLLDELARG